jgi:hypothetical protein
MKKQTVLALGLLLAMPVVLRLGGFLFSLINPERAAGHADYVLRYQFLNSLRLACLFGSFAVVAALWFLACYLVIRSKERPSWWLFLALLGPFGFAILSVMNDTAPAPTDFYARFVSKMNWLVRSAYEVATFIAIWFLAEQGMVLKRNLMILYQSATTGMSTAQIIDQQNASSGMWAFAEGNEVIFLVILLYLLRPILFNTVARLATTTATPKPN